MSLLTTIKLTSYALALVTIPSVLIRKRGHPATALGWILALIALPFVGVILWWLLGHSYMERKRKKRRRSTRDATLRAQRLQQNLGEPIPEAEVTLLPFKNLPFKDAFGVFPPSSGNRVDIIGDPTEIFPEMEEAIRDATHYIHVQFYIWKKDESGRRFRDLLAEKARSGVQVRVLCDGVGSPVARDYEFMFPLWSAGGKIHSFLPPRFTIRNLTLNFRNHRKLVIVDGHTAFTGSFNVGDEYVRDWHDFGVRLEGPVVEQVQEIFADDWFFTTGEDLFSKEYFGKWKPSGEASCSMIASGPDNSLNFTHQAYFISINMAKERIWITTPYFIPEESTLLALSSAVYRGVDVRLLLPRYTDVPFIRLASQSYYPELISAGVRIHEYNQKILHAKAMVIDSHLSVIGSANFDCRSFKLNFEASCFIGSHASNQKLAAIFERDLLHSDEITSQNIARRPYWKQVAEAGAHLLSPLL